MPIYWNTSLVVSPTGVNVQVHTMIDIAWSNIHLKKVYIELHNVNYHFIVSGL